MFSYLVLAALRSPSQLGPEDSTPLQQRYGSMRNFSASTLLVYGRGDAPRRRMTQSSFDKLFQTLNLSYYDGSSGDRSAATCTGKDAAGFRNVLKLTSFSNLTFADQIRLFHQTDVALLPRGASSANAVFFRPGSLMIEIWHPCRADDWQVWRLAQDRGVLYVDHLGGTVKADGAPCSGSKDDVELNADMMMRDDDAIHFVVRLAGCRGATKRAEGHGHEAFGCAVLCRGATGY